jgi:hypothetical protein
MKTTRLIYGLSFLLVLGLAGGISATTLPGSRIKPVNAIKYQVNIHFSSDIVLCNLYLVEVLDQNGRLVSPAQTYHSQSGVYYFAERGPVTGTRTAVLVLDTEIQQFICPNILYTTRDSETGNFEPGQIYPFDLYPTTRPVPPVPVPNGVPVTRQN